MFGVLLSYLWHFRNLEGRIKRVGTFSLIARGERWIPIFGHFEANLSYGGGRSGSGM